MLVGRLVLGKHVQLVRCSGGQALESVIFRLLKPYGRLFVRHGGSGLCCCLVAAHQTNRRDQLGLTVLLL